MKVIVFPNAGTFASSFEFLRDMMPELDVVLYEYAGHGSSCEEQPYGTFEEMTETIAADIADKYKDTDIGIFGHCMGSYTAYEVTLLLCRKYGMEPKFLIVSGSVPPDEFDKRDKIFDSDEKFLEYMLSVDGITSEVRNNNVLLRAFLPLVRKDAERLHRFIPHQLSKSEKLNVPVGVVYGNDDKEIKAETIDNWKKCTNKYIGSTALQGDHFYLFNDNESAVKAIREQIRDALFMGVHDLRTLLENNSLAYEKRPFIQYKENGGIKAVTFREFRGDVNAFSHYLNEQGLCGKHISLIGDSTYCFFTAYYAAAIVPAVITAIDNKFTSSEICDILLRSDAEYIIYQKEYADRVLPAVRDSKRNIRTLCMDDMPELFGKYPKEPLESPIDADKEVTILYTSGTTGKSKGVMLSTNNILDNLGAVRIESGWNGENTAWLSILPNHHIYCLTVDFFFAYICGITLSLSDMNHMIEDISLFKAKKILTVPMILKYFLYNLRMTEKRNPGLSKTEVKNKLLCEEFCGFCCSAAFLEDEIKSAVEEYGVVVTQGYGMTECTSHIACDSLSGYRPGSVGKVLSKLDFKIVDNEIWTKGAGVMLGYYKDEKATAEVLEDGWLKTGDLGYLDEDGWLYLTGRKKNLIILSNGENISPEELEQIIERCEYVSEVLVLDKNDVLTAEIYPQMAYIEKLGEEKVKNAIRSHIEECNKDIASYKQIRSVVFRDKEFEKTNSRKIKRFLYNK